MRRLLVLAVALVAVLGVIVPPAMAQAPAPKVTITGLVDNVGTFTRNMSTYDFNYNRNTDVQMYGRTRGRFDVIGEVGKAKAVLGLEIDAYWGQTGFIDSNMGPGCIAQGATGALQCGAVGSGAESSFDLNTDTQGSIQVKWLYTEFPLPLIPFNTTVRLGAQPFGTAATYKLATYANGDFPGVNIVSELAPGAKLNLTYVAVEEGLTGKRDFFPFITGVLAIPPAASTDGRCSLGGGAGTISAGVSCTAQARGDDFAVIGSMEFSPFKGLDVKPMYSYFFASGLTSGAARQGRGGVIIAQAFSAASGGTTQSPFAPCCNNFANTTGADGAGTGLNENRHTVGIDARFTAGPFSLQPTVLYQWGSRKTQNTGGALAPYGPVGRIESADINAWLVDVRAGFNVGPLSLGGMVMWTSGDPAKNNPLQHIGYFQPLDTDTGYMADWGTQIMSLGIDYYQILYGGAAAAGLNPGVAIGYDKYGRISVGAKASYAITPALTVGAGASAHWTDKSVDTDGTFVTNGGILPQFVCRKTGQSCRPEGDSDYLGTELNASLTYRFAPGLAFDWALGYLFSGPAIGHRLVGNYPSPGGAGTIAPNSKDIGVNDVILTTARVRYQF
jgi:hypothetical protein